MYFHGPPSFRIWVLPNFSYRFSRISISRCFDGHKESVLVAQTNLFFSSISLGQIAHSAHSTETYFVEYEHFPCALLYLGRLLLKTPFFFFLSCLLLGWALTWGVYFFGPFVYFIYFFIWRISSPRRRRCRLVYSGSQRPPAWGSPPQPAEDVYYEKEPDRIKAILERKKAEKDASAASNRKAPRSSLK